MPRVAPRRPPLVRAACLLAAFIFLGALGRAAPPPRLQAMRDEARALLLIQSVLGWYTRTVGEPAMQAETYKGHEALLSPESVRFVGGLAAREKDEAQRRALLFFKGYLASEVLGRSLSRFDDEAQNAELRATVTLPPAKAPVPYKQLDVLAAQEKDAGRRAEIERSRAQVWRDVLNPILEKKEAEAQRLARSLGYPSYVALAEEVRMVDLRALITECARFRAATDATYLKLLDEMARKELGVPAQSLRRADLSRLRKAPRFERFFPRELMVPALRHFLAGIGLDLRTAAGTQILIDDALHEKKEHRAACFPIRVPADVRVSVKPTGGVDDMTTLFHEGGHALHMANTRTEVFELQMLGPYTLTEALAETFRYAWDDPRWLARYRAFVRAWNAERKASVPLMSDADIAEFVRLRVFDQLYYLRRYGAAKLIYEAALHGGDPSLWRGAYDGQTKDLMALYRDLFARAYGFPLSAEDAQRYRTDVDDMFYSADYTRAFALANLIHEGLRQRFGEDWYGKPEVGALLKGSLFADGNRLQPDEVAKLFGFARLDLRPTEARFTRLLGAR